jgi:hypothetical protein
MYDYSCEAVMMVTLGLFGANGSSSHGFTIATLLPASSLKKYVPPSPSEALSGSYSMPGVCLSTSQLTSQSAYQLHSLPLNFTVCLSTS